MHHGPASERVAAAIRAEVERQGIRQSRVAEALGVSQAAASRRLAGRVPFDADDLAELSDLLGVPVGAFFGTPK